MIIPKVRPNQPFDPKRPNGLLQSNRDWVNDNIDACVWFLENRNKLEQALNKRQQKQTEREMRR